MSFSHTDYHPGAGASIPSATAETPQTHHYQPITAGARARVCGSVHKQLVIIYLTSIQRILNNYSHINNAADDV